MKAKIGDIIPNKFRDFDTYKIQDDHVESLMESIRELNQWDAIPARKTDGGKYEIACGHHRVEAMKRLDITHVELNVSNRTDDEMLKIMVSENSTQRGHDVPAMMDSVSAITKRIAYELLRYEDFEEFQEYSLCVTIVTNKKSYTKALELLIKGEGLGAKTIRAYSGEKILSKRDTDTAIAALKDSGVIGRIVQEVQEQIQDELEEEERLERLIKEKEEEERKKKEEEIKKNKEEAERKAKVAKGTAERKAAKEAERKAKEAERKAEEEEEERKKKEEEETKKRKVKRKNINKKTNEASKNQRRAKVNINALNLFKRNAHVEEFRKIMMGKEAQKVISFEGQIVMAQHLIDNSKDEKGRDRLTVGYIQAVIMHFIRTGRYLQQKQNEKDKEEKEKDPVNKLRRIEDDLAKNARSLSTHVYELGEFFKEHPEMIQKSLMGDVKINLLDMIKDAKKLYSVITKIQADDFMSDREN